MKDFSPNHLQKREKVMLTWLGIIGALVLYGYYLLVPVFNTYWDTQNSIRDMRVEALQIRQNEKKVAEAEEKLKQLEEERLSFAKKLRFDMEDGLFMVKFFTQLKREGAVLNEFTPGTVAENKNYVVLPIHLSLKGEYRSIKKVMEYLENNDNHTRLKGLSLSATKEKEGGQAPQPAVQKTPAKPTTPQDLLNQLKLQEQLAAPIGASITAEMDFEIYSLPTPEAKLAIEGIQGWRAGTDNPFNAK